MKTEAKKFIKSIISQKLWDNYSGIDEILKDMNISEDFAKKLAERFRSDDDIVSCAIKLADNSMARKYQNAIGELGTIHVIKKVNFFGTEFTDDMNLGLGTLSLGQYLFLSFNREAVREIFGRKYIMMCRDGSGQCKEVDFYTWANRNNGKHWDDYIADLPESVREMEGR